MTKIINAKKKLSRKLGVNLWGRPNDTFLKRNYRPGQHGTIQRRPTTHSIHLQAKQKIRTYYNMLEKQFKNLFIKSAKMKGDRAENFAGALESRLDMIVFRANFAPTIFAARQLVSHKHILVNGKKVNIASYSVKPGDVVEVVEKSKGMAMIIESLQKMERDVPAYLDLNKEKMTIKYLNIPKIADIPYPFEPEYSLIVEMYSR
ncbi:30S ribosomal protein S4 [Pseudomonadota bacterium]